MSSPTAVILGVGPGLGAALVRRFRVAGLTVAAAARDAGRLAARFAGDDGVRSIACEATDEAAVARLFAAAEAEFGPADLAIYNAAAYKLAPFLDLTAADFADVWRISCLGAFHFGQQAAQRMVARGAGTILFTGSAAQMRAGASYAALAPAKSGLRALVQAMGRELAPKGIHVGHVVIDGPIASERTRAGVTDHARLLDPAAIADAYHFLYRQPRAAWTNEIDLRTFRDWP